MSQYTDYYQYEGNLAEATLQQQPTVQGSYPKIHQWSYVTDLTAS